MAKKGEQTETVAIATDKAGFAAALSEAGFTVEYGTDSVPTVLAADLESMKRDIEEVRKLAVERGYRSSYAVRGPKGQSAQAKERESAEAGVTDSEVNEAEIESFTQLSFEDLTGSAA